MNEWEYLKPDFPGLLLRREHPIQQDRSITYREGLDCGEEFIEEGGDERLRDNDPAHANHEQLGTVCELIVVIDCGFYKYPSAIDFLILRTLREPDQLRLKGGVRRKLRQNPEQRTMSGRMQSKADTALTS